MLKEYAPSPLATWPDYLLIQAGNEITERHKGETNTLLKDMTKIVIEAIDGILEERFNQQNPLFLPEP